MNIEKLRVQDLMQTDVKLVNTLILHAKQLR